MGSLRSIADVTARRLRIVLARQPTYAGACGLEHIRAHSSDRFGDFAGGPVEIGGRLFRIDEMLALNGSSTPISNKKSGCLKIFVPKRWCVQNLFSSSLLIVS
jgi:hypothetical protein